MMYWNLVVKYRRVSWRTCELVRSTPPGAASGQRHWTSEFARRTAWRDSSSRVKAAVNSMKWGVGWWPRVACLASGSTFCKMLFLHKLKPLFITLTTRYFYADGLYCIINEDVWIRSVVLDDETFDHPSFYIITWYSLKAVTSKQYKVTRDSAVTIISSVWW